MKTSNRLIVVAIALIFLSLLVYDFLLKAEYLSGNYKNPYNNFVTLKFKDFDVVDVNSSTAVSVKFVQGSFNIRIDTNALEYVRVKQQGHRLLINAVFKYGYQGNPNPYIMVISCPKLSEVNASAAYLTDHGKVTDTIVKDDWRMKQILIDGFREDNLNISQDYGSTVVLANNTISSINAVTGKSPESGSKIVILKGNQFQKATLDIRNKSKVLLDDAIIHDLKYHLTDSAKLVLTGAAQNLIKK